MGGSIEREGVTGEICLPVERESKIHRGFALSTRHTVSGIYNWD